MQHAECNNVLVSHMLKTKVHQAVYKMQ